MPERTNAGSGDFSSYCDSIDKLLLIGERAETFENIDSGLRTRCGRSRSCFIFALAGYRPLVFLGMGGSSGSLDYWRQLFRTVGADIFELIEKAILVAAVDCPKEFKDRRVQIAENLFSAPLCKCFGCCHVELQGPDDGGDARVEECRSVKRELGEKDSKVDSCNCDPEDLSRVGVSNYSYDEAEALTQVIEEERQIVGEVLRIKEVLCNKQDEVPMPLPLF